jgi:S-methylmethionine-dependent homocysteine/selenocysteine methylase
MVVAGSAGPVGTPYAPEAPASHILRERYQRHADNLAESGVDLMLAQPLANRREVEEALVAGIAVDLPVAVEVYCSTDEKGHITNLDFVRDSIVMARELGAMFAGVGCINPRTAAEAVEGIDVRGAGLPISVCAEGFDPDSPDRIPGISEQAYPAVFLEQADRYLAAGVQIVSGCCGTPADPYITGLVERVKSFNSLVEPVDLGIA